VHDVSAFFIKKMLLSIWAMRIISYLVKEFWTYFYSYN
jgi:hypothetical protein